MSDWYYADGGEQKGPINESELKADLATHKLPPDTLVWKEGMTAWTPANEVPEFTFRAAPAPAAVQPGAAPSSAATLSSSTQPVDLSSLMGKPEALEVDPADADKNKVMGILAYILFFIPLLVAKDSPFARYHANQGLALFLVALISSVVFSVLQFIPVIGCIFALGSLAVFVCVAILAVLGIINAANGKCVPLPVIGGLKIIK